MKLTVQTNFPDVAKRIAQLGKEARFVTAVALTRTAQDVQGAERAEMTRAFDRPVAYTLNSMYLKSATKGDLEARVWLKDNPFGKGTPADRYLSPQIYGGTRGQKGMEKLLQRNGMMPAGWFAVPAAGAQLDGNGNVSRGQIVQILSQLKIQRGAGYESRGQVSKRSQRTVERQGVTYFVLPMMRRGLKPGIYMKRRFAHGTAIRPVFIFVPHVEYKARLKFFEVGQAVVQERFPVHFDAGMGAAVAAAGLR